MSDIKTGDDVVYQDENGQSRLAKVIAVEGEDFILSTAFGTQFVPLSALSSDADMVARVRVNEAANALRWAANSNSPSRVKLGAQAVVAAAGEDAPAPNRDSLLNILGVVAAQGANDDVLVALSRLVVGDEGDPKPARKTARKPRKQSAKTGGRSFNSTGKYGTSGGKEEPPEPVEPAPEKTEAEPPVAQDEPPAEEPAPEVDEPVEEPAPQQSKPASVNKGFMFS